MLTNEDKDKIEKSIDKHINEIMNKIDEDGRKRNKKNIIEIFSSEIKAYMKSFCSDVCFMLSDNVEKDPFFKDNISYQNRYHESNIRHHLLTNIKINDSYPIKFNVPFTNVDSYAEYIKKELIKFFNYLSHYHDNLVADLKNKIKSSDDGGAPLNEDEKKAVPSKHYKVNEVVDLNRLQSVINRSLKALDIMEKKIEDSEEVTSDLNQIKIIEYEARKLMKNSLGFKQKTTTESIQFLYDQREKNIENYLNEQFELCDKLINVINKGNNMILNESIGEKVKSIGKAVKKGALALIKKLRDIGLQILAFIKKLVGVNRIQAEGNYIDINKALDIVNKIISKYS